MEQRQASPTALAPMLLSELAAQLALVAETEHAAQTAYQTCKAQRREVQAQIQSLTYQERMQARAPAVAALREQRRALEALAVALAEEMEHLHQRRVLASTALVSAQHQYREHVDEASALWHRWRDAMRNAADAPPFEQVTCQEEAQQLLQDLAGLIGEPEATAIARGAAPAWPGR